MDSQPDDRTLRVRRVAYALEAWFVGVGGKAAIGVHRPLIGVLLLIAASCLIAGVVAPRRVMRFRGLEAALHFVAAAVGVFAILALVDVIRHPPPVMHRSSGSTGAARATAQPGP